MLEPAIIWMTRSYPSQRRCSAVTDSCDRACAADLKTASLCSQSFIDVREAVIFGASVPGDVHGFS